MYVCVSVHECVCSHGLAAKSRNLGNMCVWGGGDMCVCVFVGICAQWLPSQEIWVIYMCACGLVCVCVYVCVSVHECVCRHKLAAKSRNLVEIYMCVGVNMCVGHMRAMAAGYRNIHVNAYLQSSFSAKETYT